MFSVNTNLGAMAALQSLNATQSALKETQNEIPTGKKISSGTDNPAVYSISQTMQATVSGLSAVSDSLTFGTSVVGVAQTATSSISTLLQGLKATITQGQTSGMDTATINNSIKQVLSNIDEVAQSATFNGVNLTATAGTGVGAIAGGNIMSVVSNVAGSTISINNTDTNNGAAVTASDSAGLNLSGLSVTAGAVKVATSSATLPVTGNALNLKSSNGTTYSYVVNDGSAATTFSSSGSATQTNREVKINSTDSTASVLTKLTTAMAQDGFTGTTDNAGSLIVTGNGVTSTGSSSTLVGATNVTSTGTTAGDAIATVDAAIKQLNVNTAYLGSKSNQLSGMQTFPSALSTSLTAGIGALTDADMAAESAKLQSLQTKQSLAIQSLSIANQQPQSIMTLFR